MFKERRNNPVDRRQQNRDLGVPFKDSNGVTVRCERRHIPDRRVKNNETAIQTGESSGSG